MTKKQSSNDSNKDALSPENIRNWALTALMDAVESRLDLSKCGDHSYLASLNQKQLSKIKKINFDREGNVCSVEPTPLVDLVVAAANIAGSREAMKVKIEKGAKEEEEKGKKYRSNRLDIALVDTTEPDNTHKSKKKKTDSDNINSVIPGIG
jgi:hypothetical protein